MFTVEPKSIVNLLISWEILFFDSIHSIITGNETLLDYIKALEMVLNYFVKFTWIPRCGF